MNTPSCPFVVMIIPQTLTFFPSLIEVCDFFLIEQVLKGICNDHSKLEFFLQLVRFRYNFDMKQKSCSCLI